MPCSPRSAGTTGGVISAVIAAEETTCCPCIAGKIIVNSPTILVCVLSSGQLLSKGNFPIIGKKYFSLFSNRSLAFIFYCLIQRLFFKAFEALKAASKSF